MNNREIITKLLYLFQSQRFDDWYSRDFDQYLTGEMEFDNDISKEEATNRIRSGIARLLQIEDSDKNSNEKLVASLTSAVEMLEEMLRTCASNDQAETIDLVLTQSREALEPFQKR